MSNKKDLIGIQCFNRIKFHIWKWQISNLFCAKGYIWYINGTAEYDLDDKEYKEQDYNAYILLTS